MSMDGFRTRLSYANVMSTVAVFIALGGGAYAASGGFAGANGVIRLCVGKRGTVTVAKAGHRCRRKTRAVLVNQRGIKGATGLQGAQGPAGPTGPTGPATGPAGGALTGNYPDPRLADRSVTTSTFAAGARAPDAALLGGVAPLPAATPMTLLNGWKPYGDGISYDQPAYWIDAFGVVHLKGSVAQSPAGSDVIFTLPPGMRPARSTNWPATLDSATFGTIEIEANGDVRSRTFSPAQATRAQAFTSMEGVSFRPSDP